MHKVPRPLKTMRKRRLSELEYASVLTLYLVLYCCFFFYVRTLF